MRLCALVVYVRPPPLDFECSENIGQLLEISSVNTYTTASIYVRVYVIYYMNLMCRRYRWTGAGEWRKRFK